MLLFFLQDPAFFDPAVDISVSGPSNAKRSGRHILGDGGPCGYISAFSHGHRGDQIGIAANKCILFDNGTVFFRSIIIDEDHTAADIHTRAHICVAYI